MQPLVSVIITTYKRPLQILERAIESATGQSYENLQIIVVNDYPEDTNNTTGIKNYILSLNDSRIEYLDYGSNRGACFARNYGAKKARGEYLAFLDDDDTWLPEKVSKQIVPFSDSSIGMVYSPFYEFDEKNQGNVVYSGTQEGDLSNILLEKNCIGGCSMTMIRKEVFDRVEGFDEKLLASQDYDLWVRISFVSKIALVNCPLAKRYLSEDSISINFEKKKQGWEYFNQKYSEYYNRNSKLYCLRNYNVISQSIELKHFRYALNILHKNIMIRYPLKLYTYYIVCKVVLKLFLALFK